MQRVAGCTDHAVELRGLRFHYLEWGDPAAPPMVLLHGLTGHAHIWDHMAPEIASGEPGQYRILAPDQRGHGDTSHAPSYETREFAADLEALRQHWGIERFVLGGLSMGAHNSILYAATHPQRVSRLILIDIPPAMDREHAPNRAEMEKIAREGHKRHASVDDAFAEARIGMEGVPDEYLRYRTEHNLVPQDDGTFVFKYDPVVQEAWDPQDLWGELSKLTMPVLLVRAGLSQVLSRSTAERMAAALPECELVEVEGSRHSIPTHMPEALTPIVLDWLKRKGRA